MRNEEPCEDPRLGELVRHLNDAGLGSDLRSVYTEACQFLGIQHLPSLDVITSSEPLLQLHNCYFSRLHFLALTIALPLRTWTEGIVFGQQRLDSSMLLLLLPSISCLPRLANIDVSHNPIGSLGVTVLVRLARQCPALKVVNIDGIEVVPSVRKRLENALSAH